MLPKKIRENTPVPEGRGNEKERSKGTTPVSYTHLVEAEQALDTEALVREAVENTEGSLV